MFLSFYSVSDINFYFFCLPFIVFWIFHNLLFFFKESNTAAACFLLLYLTEHLGTSDTVLREDRLTNRSAYVSISNVINLLLLFFKEIS